MEVIEEHVIEQSEDENDQNLINMSKVRKRAKIIDSDDSENEEACINNIRDTDLSEEDGVSTLRPEPVRKTNLKRIAQINSDSDEDDQIIQTKNINLEVTKDKTGCLRDNTSDVDEEEIASHDENYSNNQLSEENTVSSLTPEPARKTKLKRMALIDSDSEDDNRLKNKNINVAEDTTRGDASDVEDVVDEEEVAPHNKSFPNEETAVKAVIYTTNNKGELIKENSTVKKSSLAALCDSESEAEIDDVVDATMNEIVQPKIYKRRQKKNPEEKSTKMTAQDAVKQRMEIQSESQRMLRESNISLPYHKPKSYTIKEFLQKRSKLASALPSLPKAPPSIAMKMSKDQLKEVSEKLNERMKEVERFYKSESEDEEEEDDASEEIRSWLDLLVDKAVDEVEEKFKDVSPMEVITEDGMNDDETHEKQAEPRKSMEYDFNLDDVNEEDSQKRTNFSEIIKDKLNIQPKLTGSADDIIDFEDGVTRVSGVRHLLDKFFQHTAKKGPHKHKVHLNVVEICSGGEIVQETVSMNVDEEDEPALVETPGAKLQKLREELQQQMAQKRLELWKQKREQGDCLTVEKKTDKEGYEDEAEHDILDDEEEEFEMTESESEEDEDEEEEENVTKDKPKVKSAFVDDEADEDDVDAEVENDDDEMESIHNDIVSDDQNEDNEGFEADVEETTEKEELQSPRKRVMRRIVKPFCLDSDDEDSEEQQSQIIEDAQIKYYATDEDDIIPPNLPRVGKTPQRTQLDKSKSEFDFLTPVTYLTGLQNLNSDSKFLHGSPNSPFAVPFNVSESQESSSQPQSQVQKKLFSEMPDESQNSQQSIEDLAQLCSGTFSETQNYPTTSPEQEGAEEIPSTQDLLNLCSGDFSTQAVPTGTAANSINQEKLPTSEKIIIHQVHKIYPVPNSQKEIKCLDEEQDQIISQLLDEDELERFKKKFESPVNPVVRKAPILENISDVEEANATGLINSDDENEELEIKQKKRKKLVFSDDEDEPSNDGDGGNDDDDEEPERDKYDDNEEEIDLHDNVDDEEQQLENEIVAQESRNYKLTDFLDKEAELSESEWGSADEDEKDLDELEFEEGDKETFNENKMRSEIERIHMRQLLDEDNREVKLLQELLLEDGELHGTGRKRQFKWRALDSAGDGEFEKRDDDDIFLDEEESEEQWRKMRHKREMFLKKKASADDDGDSVLSDSGILKIGQQIFKNKSSSSQNSTPTNKPAEDASPLALLNKRGSFLSRKDEVLRRLAEYNKVTETTGASTAKNSKSFVFQRLEASNTIIKNNNNNNKRKAAETTPNIVKKLRLSDISPAVGTKSTTKSSKAKKLFGNW